MLLHRYHLKIFFFSLSYTNVNLKFFWIRFLKFFKKKSIDLGNYFLGFGKTVSVVGRTVPLFFGSIMYNGGDLSRLLIFNRNGGSYGIRTV